MLQNLVSIEKDYMMIKNEKNGRRLLTTKDLFKRQRNGNLQEKGDWRIESGKPCR